MWQNQEGEDLELVILIGEECAWGLRAISGVTWRCQEPDICWGSLGYTSEKIFEAFVSGPYLNHVTFEAEVTVVIVYPSVLYICVFKKKKKSRDILSFL